jgi:hypothetical protein
MGMEQLGLLVVGWLAMGFVVALSLGKFLREADQLGRTEWQSTHAAETSRAAVPSSPTASRKKRRTRVTPPLEKVT